MIPDDSTTLGAARDWLREQVDDGVECPCCTQLAKVYRRKVLAAAAIALIQVYRRVGTEWVHIPSLSSKIAATGGTWALMAHWQLIEEATEKRDDGGRAGWWRITPYGERFVRNTLSIPKYARVYDGRLLSLVGEQVTIVDALGTKFDYRDLMEGR